MFKFEKTGWKANRGTGGEIAFIPHEYQELKEEDVIKLNIYNKLSYDKEPILSKKAEIDIENNIATGSCYYSS